MSSMLKKKGGPLAFKPKAPQIRRAAPAPTAPPQALDNPATTESSIPTTSETTQDTPATADSKTAPTTGDGQNTAASTHPIVDKTTEKPTSALTPDLTPVLESANLTQPAATPAGKTASKKKQPTKIQPTNIQPNIRPRGARTTKATDVTIVPETVAQPTPRGAQDNVSEPSSAPEPKPVAVAMETPTATAETNQKAPQGIPENSGDNVSPTKPAQATSTPTAATTKPSTPIRPRGTANLAPISKPHTKTPAAQPSAPAPSATIDSPITAPTQDAPATQSVKGVASAQVNTAGKRKGREPESDAPAAKTSAGGVTQDTQTPAPKKRKLAGPKSKRSVVQASEEASEPPAQTKTAGKRKERESETETLAAQTGGENAATEDAAASAPKRRQLPGPKGKHLAAQASEEASTASAQTSAAEKPNEREVPTVESSGEGPEVQETASPAPKRRRVTKQNPAPQASEEAPAAPTPALKRKRAAKKAAPQPTENGDTAEVGQGEDETTAAEPTAKRQRKKVAFAVEPEQENGEPPAPKSSARMRLQKKRAAAAKAAQGEASDEQADGESAAPIPASNRPQKMRTVATEDADNEAESEAENEAEGEEEEDVSEAKRRRQRSVTPEDAETQEVDRKTVTLKDLTEDLHIGKKFSRHDELKTRRAERRRAYRLARKGEAAAEDVDENAEEGEDQESTTPEDGAAPETDKDAPPTIAQSGIGFEVIDGEIVINKRSTVVDFHAQADAERGVEEEIEEDEFTHRVTSHTFLKAGRIKGPNNWTEDETELFYRGLITYGTDFNLIAKMFPKKTRRHVKMKFNREEKNDGARIDTVFKMAREERDEQCITPEELKELTGEVLQPTKDIQDEIKHKQEEFDAEQKRHEEEIAEEIRQKRAELRAPKTGAKSKGGKGTANADAAADAGVAANGEQANGVEKAAQEPAAPRIVDGLEEYDETDLPAPPVKRSRAKKTQNAAPSGFGGGGGRPERIPARTDGRQSRPRINVGKD